jgi:CheY-like chemotaxis protein
MSQPNPTQQFVLVVEENLNVKPDIRAALSFYGYEVIAVQDGDATHDAVEYGQEHILSDVYMDGKDGLQFLKAAQAVEQWYDIPVVLVSAMMEGIDKWRNIGGALKLNQVAYLARPTEAQDLFSGFHRSHAFASV